MDNIDDLFAVGTPYFSDPIFGSWLGFLLSYKM